MKEVTIESKEDYTNYSLEDFIRDTGLNGVSKNKIENNNLLLNKVKIESKEDYNK